MSFRGACVKVENWQVDLNVLMIGCRAEDICINHEWAPNWCYAAAQFERAFDTVSGRKVQRYSMQDD